MAGSTPETLEETIVLRLNEESEHSTSAFRSISSVKETLRSAYKKRPVEAPIVSLPKCNVCEMTLIGVRGWWAYAKRSEFSIRLSPLLFSFSLVKFARTDVSSFSQRVKTILKHRAIVERIITRNQVSFSEYKTKFTKSFIYTISPSSFYWKLLSMSICTMWMFCLKINTSHDYLNIICHCF